jgi:hypothetical protein
VIATTSTIAMRTIARHGIGMNELSAAQAVLLSNPEGSKRAP